MRPSKRRPDELRQIRITRGYTKHAEGSVLIEFGSTHVLCNASVVSGVPRFLKDSGQGWITAEYSMLPRATTERVDREAVRGRQTGRTLEIQRLIGRSLRAAVNLKRLGNHTILVDCDVIQADGGTRTASITGAYVALVDAFRSLQRRKKILDDPLIHRIAAVSTGVYRGTPVLDLDYPEDSRADMDMNIVMNEANHFIELQGTAESKAFSKEQLDQMLALAQAGIQQLFAIQEEALSR